MDWLLGTHAGQWFSLLFVAGVLLGAACVAWQSTGGNKDADDSFAQSMWMSYGLFIDPGTQTGVPADDPVNIKAVAAIFSVLGFVWNLAALGIVVELIRTKLTRWRETRGRIVANGHTLILGWGDRTLFLLCELLHAYERQRRAKGMLTCSCCCRRGRRRVVVLAEKPVLDMEQEVKVHLAHHGLSAKWMSFQQGDPANPLDLRKVSASSADDVIVMGTRGPAATSDKNVLHIVLGLATLGNLPWEVWVEMRLYEDADIVGTVLPGAEGIVSRLAVNRILCLCALLPPVGQCYVDMISFRDANNLYSTVAEGCLVDLAVGDACTFFPEAVLVGIARASRLDSDPHFSTVHGGYRLCAGDRLLLLASSREAADAQSAELIKRIKRGSSASATTSPSAMAATMHDSQQIVPGIACLGPTMGNKKVVIVVGCPPDLPDFLSIMNLYLHRGSEVHILSEQTVEERHTKLQLAFLPPDAETSSCEMTFKNLTLVHYVGPTTSKRHLAMLPLQAAHSIVILSAPDNEEEPPMAIDARCLNTLITLRSLRSDSVRIREGCSVLCELLDPGTQRAMQENTSLQDMAVFFFSNALETALFADASEDKDIFNTVMLLLHPQGPGANIVAASVDRYLYEEQEEVSFWELHRRAFAKSDSLLLGWQRHGEATCINPGDKNLKLRWRRSGGDELLLVAPRSPSCQSRLLTRSASTGSAKTDAETPAVDWGLNSGMDILPGCTERISPDLAHDDLTPPRRTTM